jgi:biopolymer transport protein ExbD
LLPEDSGSPVALQIKKNAFGSLCITPLIDVVFLLLIFFLVATRFAEEERELDLELPTASQSLPLTAEPLELFINIDSQGRYFVAGEFHHVEAIEQLLRQAAANNPLTQSVIIRADRRANWESVLTALDLCKKAGIYNYTATTD